MVRHLHLFAWIRSEGRSKVGDRCSPSATTRTIPHSAWAQMTFELLGVTVRQQASSSLTTSRSSCDARALNAGMGTGRWLRQR